MKGVAENTLDHTAEIEVAGLPFRAGDRIADKYEVIRLLGSGGMAIVVAAKHLELDETVALKFLRSECLANPDLVARFADEARASVKVRSEHVARVFDVGTMPDGAPFIVMEYLEGQDLGALLREQGKLPLERACDYVIQACEALAAAHAIGIVHRDVKPENLFLVGSGHELDIIKLLDFGISKLSLRGSGFGHTGERVKTTMWMGTPIYMSPEQIRATGDLDGRSDIWSLGCVLFELLTGHPPFKAPSVTLLTATILERPAPRLRDGRPELPAELEVVVARCLEKDPNARFQNVRALAAALLPFAPSRLRFSDQNSRLSSWRAARTTTRMHGERTATHTAPAMVARRRRSSMPTLAGLCVLLAGSAFAVQHPRFAAMVAVATSAATIALENTTSVTVTAPAPKLVTVTAPAPEPVAIPELAKAETEAVRTQAQSGDAVPTIALTPAESAPAEPKVEAQDTTHPDGAVPITPNPSGAVTRPRRTRPSPKSRSQVGSPDEVDVGF